MDTKPLATVAVALLLVLAGCSGGVTDGDTTPSADATTDGGEQTDGGATESGTRLVLTRASDGVNFYVSDEENAIGDFRHLNVTISRVGFQRAEGGWVEHEVDGRTVDLTRLRGANATRLTTVDAPDGTYNKVFAYVSDVDATLTSGESVRVKLPSEKLQLNSEFTVGGGESVDFVFDIAVHRAGNSGKYILRPVVGQSGTDVPIDSVDDEGEGIEVEFRDEGTVTPGGNATLEVTRDDAPVANATVRIDDERVGTTDGDGLVTVPVPNRTTFTLVVQAGDDVADLRVTFERDDEHEVEAEENDDGGDESEAEEDREETDAEADDDTEGDDESPDLDASFVGTVTRGGNATVAVTANGTAVANATVVVNDETVGTTDARGRYTFAVPDAEELTVEVTEGDREAELEVAFES